MSSATIALAVAAPQPPGTRRLIAAQLFGALAIGLYWAMWFGGARSAVAVLDTESYFAFENAFPIADGWLAMSAMLAARSLWLRRQSGLLWVIVAGSSSIFLGLIDLLFDLQNGVFLVPTGGEQLVEAVVIAIALGLGTTGVVWAWTHRRYFFSLN